MAEEKKYKVLIVDDDEFLLNMYSVKFTKNGLDVLTSTSSDDTIQKLRDGLVPDAMLLDIVMPGTDGFGLLERIRKENLAPKSVVIFLTNQSQSVDIDRAKSLGVQGYIVKASTIPSEVYNEVMKCLTAAVAKK